MNNNSYQLFHQLLLNKLLDNIKNIPPFDQETDDDASKILSTLREITHPEQNSDAYNEKGQWLVTTIIARYPQFTTLLARDLLWHFGGDCMHFLGDEEIEAFQKLDENYHQSILENPQANYEALRKTIVGQDYFTPNNPRELH